MAVTVKIPTQLRAAAGGETEARVDGGTVGEALDALFARHGELRDRLSDGDGLDTPVADGQEIQVLPAVAGG